MTAPDRDRQQLRQQIAAGVDDTGGDLLDYLEGVYLGQGMDAQVIACALEAIGRRLAERAAAGRRP